MTYPPDNLGHWICDMWIRLRHLDIIMSCIIHQTVTDIYTYPPIFIRPAYLCTSSIRRYSDVLVPSTTGRATGQDQVAVLAIKIRKRV